jgi:hypothetical protein
MSTSTTYTMNMATSAAAIGPLTVSDIAGIDLTSSYGEKKLPNKKISFDVHTAHGGYVVRVSNGYGIDGDMYVIDDTKDLGNELGKIVTHHTLAKV